MLDKEKRFEKVIAFYQSLPGDLIDEIILKLPGNRDMRRKITKIKSNKDKVKMIMSTSYRKIFVDTAYNTIKNHIPLGLELENAGYDDIINSITDDNKSYMAIFFFRWCYEKGVDGSSNDDKYFETFVDSEIFDCILNGKTIDKRQPVTEDIETVSEIDTRKPIEEAEKPVDDIKQDEVKTMKLLGRIEKRNIFSFYRTTYYNFFPQYELIDDRLVEISTSDLKTQYPTKGGINLPYSHPYSSEVASFLEEIPTDFNEDNYINNVYVLEIDDNNLGLNSYPDYKYKLDLQGLVQQGKKLYDIIRHADDYGIYKVVTSDVETISEKTFINGNINLNESNVTEGEMVVLDYNEKYYGPFEVSRRTYDNKFYINTSASESNYLVSYFISEDVEVIELEKQAYYQEPTYTKFIHISLDKKQFEDTITDEILLEKITDDISIELAKNNPEEFFHLYSNSPFLAELPKEIVSKRFDRLIEIVNNVENFKEKKHDVFDSLLKLYQDIPSEISDKMITDSDTVKKLKKKYNDERSKSEDAEKKILELEKEKENLNSKIAEMTENNNGAVSSEEINQLESEIEKLREELDEKTNIINDYENVENLKEEQEKLIHNNEFLNDQAKGYEKRIKSAQEEISNAIEKSASNMASLAFDPFISSEMIKKAASWNVTEESKEYQERSEKLSSVIPSELRDDALIDYIVNYVKERREYSRNDIINIYICIAQNFITVFSGEPGTGKTSMCNIIAETLGLLDYGDDINRFVSVSVERGWS